MDKKEGLISKDAKVELFHKDNFTSPLEQKLFTPHDSTLVIQGFPSFIMQNAEEFANGKSKKITLLLPSMMRELQFDVKPQPHDLGPNFIKLNIDISNWFLKMFTDRIEIVYNKQLHQQVSYYGITVIRKSNGGNEKYKMTYEYL